MIGGLKWEEVVRDMREWERVKSAWGELKGERKRGTKSREAG